MKDAVEASMLVLGCQHCAPEVINIGTGKPTTTSELAKVLMMRAHIRNGHADVGKAGRVLDHKPSIRLEEGARQSLQSSDMKVEP